MEEQQDEKFPFKKEPQAKPEEPQKVVRAVARDIALRDGQLHPVTHSEAWRIAETLLKSNALPRSFENAAQVFLGQQFLRQLGIPDVVGFRQLAIINGTLSIFGDLPKALAERSGFLEDFDEFFFLDDYTPISFENKNLLQAPWGAYCKVKRRGRTPVVRVFTVEDAKTAGLWNSKDTWKKYPKRMLQLKARGWALKDAVPDVLMGAAVAEHDFDTTVEPGGQVVGATTTAADDLNQEFLGDGK